MESIGAHIQLMVSHLAYKNSSDPGKIRRPGWHRDYGAATKVFGDHVPRVLLKCAFYLNDLTQPKSGMTLVAPGSNRDRKPIGIPEGELAIAESYHCAVVTHNFLGPFGTAASVHLDASTRRCKVQAQGEQGIVDA